MLLAKAYKMKYCHRFLILFAVFFCFQNTSILLAHTTTTCNIGNVAVDDLTNAQLKDLMKQAQASDLNVDQLKNLAILKGMSEDNAKKLQIRICAPRKNTNSQSNTTTANQSDMRQLYYIVVNNNGTTKEAKAPLLFFGVIVLLGVIS